MGNKYHKMILTPLKLQRLYVVSVHIVSFLFLSLFLMTKIKVTNDSLTKKIRIHPSYWSSPVAARSALSYIQTIIYKISLLFISLKLWLNWQIIYSRWFAEICRDKSNYALRAAGVMTFNGNCPGGAVPNGQKGA